MKMMHKLLGHLHRVWNTAPKDFGALVIEQGSSPSMLVTVDTQYLTIHSGSFRSDMPLKQALSLDDCTLSELTLQLSSIGYSAYLTQETIDRGYGGHKACVLMPCENIPLTTVTLKAFTSPLWQLLYPLARLLEELDNDSDRAIAQIYMNSTTGKWMDYWGTFFKIKRLVGESDIQLQKRIFLSLMNMKTNNIALQELLKYSTNGSAVVTDYGPAEFEVFIDPEYMGTVSTVRQIIADAKGAGIDYFLNYRGIEEEDYRAHLTSLHGLDFSQSDKCSSTASLPFVERTYGYEQDRLKMFRVGRTKIRTGGIKILPKVLSAQLGVIIEPRAEVFSTPTELVGSIIEMPSDTYPRPSEVLVAREVSISDSYLDPIVKGLVGFRTNFSKTFSATDPTAMAKLSILEQRYQESLSMTLTVGEDIVRSM